MTQHNRVNYDLFISYAEDDSSWVCGYLIPELGLPSDRVITKEQFTPGASIIREFDRAVNESRFTVLVLTPAYHADEWAVYGEQISSYASVAERRDHLIPLRLEPSEMSLAIAFRVSLDCTKPDQWKSEIGRLRVLLGQPEPPAEVIPCPYPGLETFTEENAEFYVGRELKVREIGGRLWETRAITIIGPSGCGKSSFLHAGLIPFLKSNGASPLAKWLVIDFRPGSQPLNRLSSLLAQHLGHPTGDVAEALRTKTASLPAYLAQITTDQPNGRVMLIVDQFEEVFSQCKDLEQRNLFFAQLQDVFEARPERVFLMIAVRSDFYGDCQKSSLWPYIEASLVNLLPLAPVDLRRAITEPARKVGVLVAPALVERLMADAEGEPGVLPLLQETMKSLWKDHLRRRLLALADYADMDSAGRTGLQSVLDARAEATMAQLIGTQKRDIARRIFVRLVEFGDQHRNTRRQQPEDALQAESDPDQTFHGVLDYLISQRLLTTDRDPETGKVVIDLVHETLIDAWRQFGVWLESFHTMEEARRGLVLSATVWDTKGRDASYLYGGKRLQEAETWPQAWQNELGTLEHEFLTESRRFYNRQRVIRLLVILVFMAIGALILLLIARAAQRELVRTGTGSDLVHIEGGRALVGSNDPDADPDENATTVDLMAFAIEKYEVSIGQYKACVDHGPCTPPRIPDILDDTAQFDMPIVDVSASQAESYCTWLDRRLPTSVEWERAARGTEGRLWPWGNEPGSCEEFSFGCGIVSVRAGDEAATPLPEEVYHLGSNVSEWVVLASNNCKGGDCHASWDGKSDQIAHMGSAWDIPFDRISQKKRSSRYSVDESTGFRCVFQKRSINKGG
jgi:hypothetical protein